MSTATVELSGKQIENAARRLGQTSWRRLKETLTEEELRKRQSKAGSFGGRPRKDSGQ